LFRNISKRITIPADIITAPDTLPLSQWEDFKNASLARGIFVTINCGNLFFSPIAQR
jgi:hypothetical protein